MPYARPSRLRPRGSTADPLLSVAELIRLTDRVKCVIVFNSSDLASSCNRAKQELARAIAIHNKAALADGRGVIIFIDGRCSTHILHREIENTFSTKDRPGILFPWGSVLVKPNISPG